MMERFLLENHGDGVTIGLDVTDYKSVAQLQASVATALEAMADKIEGLNILDPEGDPISRDFFMALLLSKICQAVMVVNGLPENTLHIIVNRSAEAVINYEKSGDVERLKEAAAKALQQYNMGSMIKGCGDD